MNKDIPVVILCGGMGTRLAEETDVRPKPMVEVGGQPILWHIMKHYSHYGFNEFIMALGYKGEQIKRYFLDFYELKQDLCVSLQDGHVRTIKENYKNIDSWQVHLVDTGQATLTGGRLKRLEHLIGNRRFMMTYGDGVSDIDLSKLLDFHRKHGALATVTAVRPPARFGMLQFEGNRVTRFSEKSKLSEGWINGGFFVLEPAVLKYVEGDETLWEHEPLERLSAEGQLYAYRHESFWQCMDTLRDLRYLESLWASGNPPWKTW